DVLNSSIETVKQTETEHPEDVQSTINRLINVDDGGHLYGVAGGSGDYAETIFRYAAKVRSGVVVVTTVKIDAKGSNATDGFTWVNVQQKWLEGFEKDESTSIF
ncbi:hypothetical protein CCACVL1_29501, partial [Corchorus capsularis]